MKKTKHHNKESVVKCPVEGCDHEGLSRGINLHVRQSSGNGHGEHGDVPDNLNFSELERVGEKDVEYNYPDEREVENVARLCPFCGRAFSGYQGVKIHLGQKQGEGVHDEDTSEITKEDCPVAHVDDDMNVIEVVEDRSIMPSTKRRIESAEDSVPKRAVHEMIAQLKDEGDDDMADRLESNLL